MSLSELALLLIDLLGKMLSGWISDVDKSCMASLLHETLHLFLLNYYHFSAFKESFHCLSHSLKK